MLPVFRTLAEARTAPADTLAIGFFDGLHRGHREVILGGASPGAVARTVVFTFDPHPARILRPDRAPALLTGFPHKARILADWGVGGLLAFPFDEGRSRQEGRCFLEEIFEALPWVQEVRVGARWRFGHDRAGDTTLLGAVCGARGIGCRIAPDVEAGGCPVSSSRIREAIRSGDLVGAAEQLGRPYCLLGEVVEGRKLGRKLGFPTANLSTADECFPPPGVYAGWVGTPDGRRHGSVMNLGTRPTVETGSAIHAEAHILEGSHDLYGAEVSFEPVCFLRGTEQFAGMEALAGAIRNDVARAREVLKMG